ncbi:hypothetical protein PQX77_001387 [Marasmius sp. AFHP31]|nr:hypothetical protein PQX77_001387 [Marasmius sp. AFHP31]
MVEARHAELLASPSLSSLSKPTTTTKIHPNLPANAHLSGRCAPERVGPKSWAELRTPTVSASSSKLVDVRTEDLLTAVTNDIPRHGLFSPQDDAVLLQYLIRRNGGSTIDCHGTRKSSMTTSMSSLEVDMFNHLIDTVPDARKHTAQTWRKHYQRLKSHFDRLVDHFGRTFTPNEVEMVDDEQEECRPRKRRKLDGPGDSVGEDDEPELGAWTNECPETTFHLETSDEYIAVGDLDPTDEDLVEELEVERSLYHDGAHSGI